MRTEMKQHNSASASSSTSTLSGSDDEDEILMESLIEEDPSEYGPKGTDRSILAGSRRGLHRYSSTIRDRLKDAIDKLSTTTIIISTLLIILLFFILLLSLILPKRQVFGQPRWNQLGKECQLCSPKDEICAKWGSRALLRGRSFQGSGEQLVPFLDKVRSGKDIKIGIIGGSISACIDSTLENCYHTKMTHQLEKDWGIKIEIVNGALSAVGSDFFASCWSMAFADPIDLFILELGVNDEGRGKENPDFDVLVRALMEHSWKPSLVVLSMYSPLHPYTNGAPSIESIAQYYDLPVISHRNLVVQQRHLHNKIEQIRPWFATGGDFDHPTWSGGHHPGPLAHELTSDLLVSYFREQLCTPTFNVRPRNDSLDLPSSLPGHISPWSPFQWPDDQPHEPTSTFKCFTAAPGPVHFPIAESHGFTLSKWKAKEYLVGYNVGDKVVFNLNVTHGIASIMYWRSASLGFGRASFWLDGEQDKAAAIWGDWDNFYDNVPVRHDFHTDRNGPRQMTVQIHPDTGNGKHEFRISAVIA